MRGLTRGILGLVLAASLSGCWVSKFEGEQMQAAARERDERLNELESRTSVNHQELDEKIAQLEELLARATNVLQRDSADVGAQIESQRQQIAALEGQLAELQHNFTQFKQESAEKLAAVELQASGGAPVVPESEIPSDPTALYAKAEQEFKAAHYKEARALFEAFLGKFRSDGRASDAQYWIAATYLQENKAASALGEYRKVISDYPKSNTVKVALYGMADAFYRLRACSDAKSAITALLARKPDSDLKSRANKLLRTIKAAPRTYCTS